MVNENQHTRDTRSLSVSFTENFLDLLLSVPHLKARSNILGNPRCTPISASYFSLNTDAFMKQTLKTALFSLSVIIFFR